MTVILPGGFLQNQSLIPNRGWFATIVGINRKEQTMASKKQLKNELIARLRSDDLPRGRPDSRRFTQTLSNAELNNSPIKKRVLK
jgi:hypothetical protein